MLRSSSGHRAVAAELVGEVHLCAAARGLAATPAGAAASVATAFEVGVDVFVGISRILSVGISGGRGAASSSLGGGCGGAAAADSVGSAGVTVAKETFRFAGLGLEEGEVGARFSREVYKRAGLGRGHLAFG